jgi:hypothetical protein
MRHGTKARRADALAEVDAFAGVRCRFSTTADAAGSSGDTELESMSERPWSGRQDAL